MKNYVQLAEKYSNKKAKLRNQFISALSKVLLGKRKRVEAIDDAMADLTTERTNENNDIDNITKLLKEA